MKHYLGICLMLLTIAAIGLFALHSCKTAAHETIDDVRNAFSEVLHVQPQVTVNQQVILTQTAPIAELAVVSKEELVSLGFNEHLEVWSLPIPLTEKKLTAEGTYRLKAGFDLADPFSVEYNSATHRLRAVMPRAKILAVEPIGDVVYHGEDAMLNRITDEERNKILSSLAALARDTAEKSSLKGDAEEQVEQRLNELLRHNGETMDIEWTNAGSSSRPMP
jgi:hypothetical protein